MKKPGFILLSALIVAALFGIGRMNMAARKHKVLFAYFSGYRCPPCMEFREKYLDNFQKIYKEKYGGRVEFKMYMIDVPLNITQDSPDYEEAKKFAKKNDDMLKATARLYNSKNVGSIPSAAIGATFLDWSTDDLYVKGPNVDRAIEKALKNNETTKIVTGVSGRMQDYVDIRAAVTSNDYKAAEEFLEKGADVNKMEVKDGEYKRNLLTLAARFGDEDLVKLLLSRGADVNGKGWDGNAIEEAAFMGRTEMVELLLSKGAIMPVDIITDAGIDENMIRFLKKHGADINAVRDDGNTPLTQVLTIRQKWLSPKISIRYAEVLINEGADVNKKVTIKDDKGKTVTKTPLQLSGNEEMKKFLISKGAK